MGGTLGVDNIVKGFNLLLEIGNVADYIGRHPELGAAKWTKVFDLADEAMAMQGFDFATLLQEFKDLDDEDRGLVVSAIKSKHDIEDDILEAKIEQGLDLLVSLYADIVKIVDLVKTFKDEAPE